MSGTHFDPHEREETGNRRVRWNRRSLILLICLLVFCIFPGLLFFFWKTYGRNGLLAGIGCLFFPFLLLLWIGCVWYADHFPSSGEHLEQVDWLPAEARDISYYKSYTYTAYEFKIPEESFKKHANSSWRFREIREPEVIRRYNYIREYEEYHKNYREFRYEEYRRLQERTTATVKNGIVARHRQRNGGGYHAVYDRDTGTAYVQTNPR